MSNLELSKGGPVTPDHREIDATTGQQKDYVVLSAEERAKDYIRPLRSKYRHTICSVVTKISQSIAETYAIDPTFYDSTFCCGCRRHFPLTEFVWDGPSELVGS